MKPLILVFFYLLSVAAMAGNISDLTTIKRNYREFLLTDNKEEQELISLLIQNPREEFYGDQMVVELMDKYPVTTEDIEKLLEKLTPEGMWTDIDYKNKNRSGWEPKKHVERILILTKAYYTENNYYYQSAELERVIHGTLDYWFKTLPKSPNWWHNQIGVPKTMAAIAILFEDRLSPEEMKKVLQTLDLAQFGMTGQNKVWLAGIVLVKGLLQNDFDLVKTARDHIFSEIKTGAFEGIKEDNSFHQHGAQLQFGNYGAAYIVSMGMWAKVLSQTSISLEQHQLDILSQLINHGYRYILWKGYMDINSLGRQFFRQAQLHKGFCVGFASNQLMHADTVNAPAYKALIDENFLYPSVPNQLVSTYHFWQSDYTVHRRPEWMVSVRMSSPRVTGSEGGNGDNLKGYHLADGAMYTYVDGREYSNIFPCWDWRKIPGITCYERDDAFELLSWKGYNNGSPFVGCVTDGKTGITAMEFDRDGIQAYKSWIFAEDYVISMGAGIKADSGFVITTSIDQRLQSGELHVLHNNSWKKTKELSLRAGEDYRFFHDQTGYIVLNAEGGKAKTETRVGTWKEIMNIYPDDYIITKEVMSLWIDHGKDPENGQYIYITLPSSNKKEVKNFRLKDRVTTINSNTKDHQSVTIGNTTYIAVYKQTDLEIAEDVVLNGGKGLFMITTEEDKRKIIVVDPTQLQESIQLTIKGASRTIRLPRGEKAGTPVNVYF